MRNGFQHSFAARTSRVLCSFVAPALVGSSALLAGCSDGATVSPPPLGDAPTIMVTKDNNFSSMSSLTIPPVSVPPGEDFKICWDKLTTDIQGHPVDAKKDINDVSFIRVVKSNPDDVAKLLNDGNLQASDIDGDWDLQMKDGTDNPCGPKLSDLTVAASGTTGAHIDPKTDFTTDATRTYLMVFANGTSIGFGARTMVIIKTDPTSTVDEVDATNSSASLSYTATLSTKHVAGSSTKAERVDWSGVTTGGAGQQIGRNDVSRVLIGFYEGMQPADLEKNFLNLQQPTGTATGAPSLSWEIDVAGGQSADLSQATGRAGEGTFAGFNSGGKTGSWIMGMFCDQCQNPAPVIVTLVDPQ